MEKKLNVEDISKFIDSGSYSVDCPVNRIPQWVKEHQEMGLELNPDFQRGHVWTPKQETAYMEFLLKGGKSSNHLYFNQPGWMDDFSGEFVCVDGLQRITTICKFFNDEVPVFGGYFASEIEGLNKRLGSSCTMVIHVNNLSTRKDVLKWYLEMNSGGTPHSEEELDKVRNMIDRT